jgi:Predicted CoA-binding protein
MKIMTEVLTMDKKTKMLEEKVWAVVGASDNKKKFGYKIFKFMHDLGLDVYAVNPGLTEIMGQKCYSNLKELPVKPGAVNLVVAPTIGEQILHDCAILNIKNVWFQPGADSDEIVATANQLGLNVVHHACVMTELRKRGNSVNDSCNER